MLILRDGVMHEYHLNNDSIPHKSEDYLIRLIDEVIKHEELKKREMKRMYYGLQASFKIN